MLDLFELLGPTVFGDPHLSTLDGRRYSFQAVGEFTMARSSAPTAEVQARFGAVGSGGSASATTRVAIGDGTDRLELTETGTALHNGAPLTVDGVHITPSGLVIARVDGHWLAAVPGGLSLVARPDLTLGVLAPAGVTTIGLLGDNDTDSSNDLVTSEGETLGLDVAPHVLYGRFADSWWVTDATSLFTYPSGTTTATYTDRAYPRTIKRLSDFTVAELNAAATACKANGVAPGTTAFEDCTFDVVTTGDQSYVQAAAAVRDTTPGPDTVTWTAEGVLTEDFEEAVPSTFAHDTHRSDPLTTRVAGPIFDTTAYTFALVDVPRHDAVALTADLVAYGPPGADGDARTVELTVDERTPTWTVTLDGAVPTVTGGPAPADLSLVRDATLPDGTAVRIVRVTASVPHTATALKARLQSHGMHGVLGTSLGIDNLRIALTTSPAQAFTGALPLTIAEGRLNGAIVPGAGHLETPGAADTFRISLTAAQAGSGLLVQTSCDRQTWFRLRQLTDGALLPAQTLSCGILTFAGLVAGEYAIEVASHGIAGTYAATVAVIPDAQVFGFTIGAKVEPDRIGAVTATGAGTIETPASTDIYPFTVPAGGQTIAFDTPLSGDQWGLMWRRAKLIRTGTDGAADTEIGGVYGHKEYTLTPGAYRVEIHGDGDVGTYWFTSHVKPATQVFPAFTIGDKVEPGLVGDTPAPGAGTIELTSSTDIYPFTIPAGGQTVAFTTQTSGPGGKLMLSRAKLIRTGTDGAPDTDIGGIYYRKGYTLTPGTYRVEIHGNGDTGTYWFTSHAGPAP